MFKSSFTRRSTVSLNPESTPDSEYEARGGPVESFGFYMENHFRLNDLTLDPVSRKGEVHYQSVTRFVPFPFVPPVTRLPTHSYRGPG